MIKVGEEVNQLELFFTRVAEQYSNEVEYQVNLLNKLLEPLIIVILGLIVGIVLVAMYLPLFKLGQNF
jgi:type IV pilus assembly protein PilC